MADNYSRRQFLRTGTGLAAAIALSPLEVLADEKSQKTENKNQNSKYKTSDFLTDSEQALLARMLFGEARDCSELEKVAIAYTAINRANDGKKWNGETINEAILKPYQYSCFNNSDPNKEKLMDPEKYDGKSFQECLTIAQRILKGEYKQYNKGATHYFNPEIVKKPKWADKMHKIGKVKVNEEKYSKHEFYKED